MTTTDLPLVTPNPDLLTLRVESILQSMQPGQICAKGRRAALILAEALVDRELHPTNIKRTTMPKKGEVWFRKYGISDSRKNIAWIALRLYVIDDGREDHRLAHLMADTGSISVDPLEGDQLEAGYFTFYAASEAEAREKLFSDNPLQGVQL